MSSTIEVSVRLYGLLRRHRPAAASGAPHQPFVVILPAEATIAELAGLLSLPDGRINAAAVNGQVTGLDTRLKAGDEVNFFPPAAGGREPKIFISGVMQGSRSDHLIGDQDYRVRIIESLSKHVPEVRVIDPWSMHPDSVNYSLEQARQTFLELTSLAAEADLVIAYLPQASMGTAIEMWAAYEAGKQIVAVTPLCHNWVVRLTAGEIFPDLESLIEAIDDGRFARLLSTDYPEDSGPAFNPNEEDSSSS